MNTLQRYCWFTFYVGVAMIALQDVGTPLFSQNATAESSVATPAPLKEDGSAPSVGSKVEHEVFQSDGFSEQLDVYWCKPSEPPKAILMLADTIGRPEVFRDGAWIDFANKQQWALVVLGIGEMKTLPKPNSSGGLDQRLLSWLDAKFTSKSDAGDNSGVQHKPLPIIYHATGNGASWLHSLMLERPSRFSAWTIANATKFPESVRSKGELLGPGLIVCVGTKQHLQHLDHFEDLRASNKLSRVGFVSWDESTSVELVDSFARMSLEEMAGESINPGLWLNIHTLQPPPTEEKAQQDPVRYGWYRDSDIVGAVKALRPTLWPKSGPSMGRRAFKTRDFSSCELRWIRNVNRPKAILLIANSSLPAALRHMPEWTNYAKKHEWAIVLMSLKEDRIRSEDAAAKGLETRLYKELDGFGGPDLKNLPLVTFAQGSAATWLQTLMLRQPSRYLAWVTAGGDRFPAITMATKVPPGLLISQSESQYKAQYLHFQDLRAADPYNCVGFLALPDERPPMSMIEGGIQSFIDGSLTAKKELNRWIHLHELTPPTRSAVQRLDPRHYAWFPSPEVLGMWKQLRKSTEATPVPVIAKRVYKTGLPEVPELKLFVRLPGAVKKGQKVSGVLCFCTWQQEDTSLVNRLKNSEDYMVKFADRNDLAVITWNTANLLPPGVKVTSVSPEIADQLQEKFAAFGEAWQKAVGSVCREMRLSDDDMLLYGVSRGASFAHQISMRYPKQFLAVHTHIGSRYTHPIPADAAHALWLVTTGEVDGGYSDSLRFYKDGVSQKLPILFQAGSNLGHSSRRDIEELAVGFFSFALELKALAETRRAKDRRNNDTPVSLFRESLANPYGYGDLVNHEFVLAADATNWWVPAQQRISLPTEAIARAWSMTYEEATAPKTNAGSFNFAPGEVKSAPKSAAPQAATP